MPAVVQEKLRRSSRNKQGEGQDFGGGGSKEEQNSNYFHLVVASRPGHGHHLPGLLLGGSIEALIDNNDQIYCIL
jgi:hypothetical protein